MSNAKRLLINTLMLTASSFLMRTVSVGFNVYLTNIIGAEGIGLFQLVSTVYAMAITFASGGIRLSSMRLVADSMALGRTNQRRIMNRCLLYGLFCGIFIGLTLTLTSDIISINWLENKSTASALKILSLSLPFVSMSAALNGYFTSEGKIMRYTAVQIFEQIFKIGITVFFLSNIRHKNPEEFCNAIVLGICIAEIFSLLSSFSVYRLTSYTEKGNETKNIWRNLFRIALPDAIGAEMRSVLTTIEHILIPKGLKKAGGSVSSAIATYGIVHGMTLPVILYPSALISSLSGLLVPEISAHYTAGQHKRIHYIIRRVLHLTMIFAIGTSGIMFFNAERLSFAFYGNADCSFYIKILAPLIIVMYMDTSVDGMLKGLDQQMSYMKYNIIDSASCVVLVYFLVPVMGVKGYIFVIYLSEIINFVLSFRRLTVVSEVMIEVYKDLLIPLMGIMSSCICGEIISNALGLSVKTKPAAAICILSESIIYTLVLCIFKSIDKEEIKWLKHIIFRKS